MSDIPRAKVTESADGEISCSIEETNRIRAALGLRPLDISSSSSNKTMEKNSHPPPSQQHNNSTIPTAKVTESADGEISCSIEETNRIRAALGLRPLDVTTSSSSSAASSSSSKKEIFIDLRAQREEEQRKAEVLNRIEAARKEREMQALAKSKSLGDSLSVTKQMSTAEWVELSRKKEVTNATTTKPNNIKHHRITALAEEEDEDGFSIVNLPSSQSTKPNTSSSSSSQLTGMKIHHDSHAFKEGETTILTFADTNVLNEDGKDLAEDVDMLINVEIAAKERNDHILERKRKAAFRDYRDFDENSSSSLINNNDILSHYDEEEQEKKRAKRVGLIIQDNGQVMSVNNENNNTNTNNGLENKKTINISNTQGTGTINEQLPNIGSDYITKAELLAIAKPKGKKKLRNRNDEQESNTTTNVSQLSGNTVSENTSSTNIIQELQQQQQNIESNQNDRGSRTSRRADGISRQLNEEMATSAAGMKAFEAAVAKETAKTALKLGHAVGYSQPPTDNSTDHTWDTVDTTTDNLSKKVAPPPLITGTTSAASSLSINNYSRQRTYTRLRNNEENNNDEDNELQAALMRARRLAKPSDDTEVANSTTLLLSTNSSMDPALRVNALLSSYQQQNIKSEVDDNATKGGVIYSSATEFSGRLQADLLTNNDDEDNNTNSTIFSGGSLPGVIPAKVVSQRGISTSTINNDNRHQGWSKEISNEEENDEDMEIEDGDNHNAASNNTSEDDNDEDNNDEYEGSFTANEEKTNANISKGISSALNILRRMGATQQQEEYFGRAKDKRFDDKSTTTTSNNNNKVKEVILEYRDEEGHKLTPKQAFRELSYRFHGQAPSRHVKDKRLKKLERERQQMQQFNSTGSSSTGNQNSSSSANTGNNTMSMLQRVQETQGQAFITLEKH